MSWLNPNVLTIQADGVTVAEVSVINFVTPFAVTYDPATGRVNIEGTGGSGSSTPLSNTTPAAVWMTADIGTSTAAARGDHVHALPFSVVQAVLAGATGAVAFNGHLLQNVANPQNAQDAATKVYVDTHTDDVRTTSEFTTPAEGQTVSVTLNRVPYWMVANPDYPVSIQGAGAVIGAERRNAQLYTVSSIAGTTITLTNDHGGAAGVVVPVDARLSVGWDSYQSVGNVRAATIEATSSIECGGMTFGWGVVGGTTVPGASLELRTGAGGDLFFGNTLGIVSSKKDTVGGLELGLSGPRILWGTGAPTAAAPDGSVYLRTGVGIYARENGVWSKRLKTAVLTDADATVSVSAANRFVLLPTTYTANRTVTIGTTGAGTLNSYAEFVVHNTTAFTFTLNNGGPGAGTLAAVPANTQLLLVCAWDGTNWALRSAAPIE